jgi:hypothetical protein
MPLPVHLAYANLTRYRPNTEIETMSRHFYQRSTAHHRSKSTASYAARVRCNLACQRAYISVLVTTLACPALAITNGTPDDGIPPEFPNVGAIVATRMPLPFAGLPAPFTASSGTLIHPRVVLTAGHTLEFLDELVGLPPADPNDPSPITIEDFSVTFDFNAHDATSAIDYEVERIAYPPDYIPFNSFGRPEGSRDFGFVVLAEPVVGITPVAFPDAGFLEDPANQAGRFTAVGYGHVPPLDGPPPPPLANSIANGIPRLPSGLRYSSESEFRALRSNYVLLSNSFVDDLGGSAPGDSGGPIFAIDPESGQRIQVGLISSGDQARASLGMHFRTDTPDFLNLIQTENLEAYLGLNASAASLTSGTATAIPEPATAVLAALAVALWLLAQYQSATRPA